MKLISPQAVFDATLKVLEIYFVSFSIDILFLQSILKLTTSASKMYEEEQSAPKIEVYDKFLFSNEKKALEREIKDADKEIEEAEAIFLQAKNQKKNSNS